MRKPLRVLIVEDSDHDTALLVSALERGGYTVTHQRVQTADDMKAALEHTAWDAVLSDYRLSAFSGMAALAVVQAAHQDLPFLIVSGTIGEETAVSSLKAGAHDFLVKGRLGRLVSALEHELREAALRRERLRSHRDLQRSGAQYQSLMERAMFGMCQATFDGRLVAVNPALITMLGYDSAEDLLAVGVPNLYGDATVGTDLIPCAHEPQPFSGEEAMWHRKSGEPIRVRLSGRLIEVPSSDGPVFEVIVEDITERHRLQEQLRQAQKMEAIGHLAGGIAHDFNNLLTAILGYSELLSEQIGPDKPIGRDLREIMNAAQRAAALTRQLLAFSRKQVLAMTALDLNEVVRHVATLLRRLLGEPITINTALADELYPVMADATQLEQVLMNLAVNARDAMPQGGVLSIETRNAELDLPYTWTHPGAKPGSYARLSVCDTGTGMTREVQARIFEPFFTTKERGRGTGLGLAAVYGIVKQLGGYVGVESEPGRGTTFQIYLPMTNRAAQATTVPAVVASPVGRETILLVEDESSVREFTKIALQRFGYRVVDAPSAETALTLLEGFDAPIHLLLTDVILPGMDGRELAVRVARDRPRVQILFMSGYTDRMGTAEGFLEPGVQLLAKPFTAQALLTRTRQLLGTS